MTSTQGRPLRTPRRTSTATPTSPAGGCGPPSSGRWTGWSPTRRWSPASGGGGAAPRAIVLAGSASLVAGAISMALGEYTSVKTQNEQLDLEVEKERHELAAQPRGRAGRAGRRCCGSAGSTTGWPSAVAVQLSRDPETALRLHVVAELGPEPRGQAVPGTAAVSSFLTFGAGALLPLLPYLLGASSLWAGRSCAAASGWSPPALSLRVSPRGPGGGRACVSCSSGPWPPASTYLIGSGDRLLGVAEPRGRADRRRSAAQGRASALPVTCTETIG